MACNNGFLIGNSTITTKADLSNTTYTGFTFNGNCILDSILISNVVKIDAEVLATSVSALPDWTPDIKFLASFNNTLDASNVFGMTGSPTSWSLYRRVYQGDILTLVATISPEITEWVDYKIEGGQKSYEYLLFANSDTQISSPIITDKVTTSFSGYYLCSSDADFITSVDTANENPLIADGADAEINSDVEVYKFDLNTKSNTETINNSAVFLQNYSKFDSVVIGSRNYRSSSFSVVLVPPYLNDYDFNGKINWQDYLDSLHDFLASSDYKYLKDKNGSIIKVVTMNSSSSSMDYTFTDEVDMNGQKVVTCNIYWSEIGEV